MYIISNNVESRYLIEYEYQLTCLFILKNTPKQRVLIFLIKNIIDSDNNDDNDNNDNTVQ